MALAATKECAPMHCAVIDVRGLAQSRSSFRSSCPRAAGISFLSATLLERR
jgi:hypothetical protein